MKVKDNIITSLKSIKEIRENYIKNLLIVDNEFQRNHVWNKKNDIQLIETILLGYLIPEIYLWNYSTDPNTGETIVKIVDGQQRLTAINAFLDNKFALEKKYLIENNEEYNNKYFSELDDKFKRYIWNYTLDITTLKQEVTNEEIIKLFIRLNITNKPLTNQELRHASYNGEFRNCAEAISQYEFWKEHKIFTDNEIKRMKDIEFISGLLVFLRDGIKASITQAGLYDAYDKYNLNYYSKEEDVSTTKKILTMLDKLFLFDKLNVDLYSKNTHFYTLFVLMYNISRKGYPLEDMLVKIKNFYLLYSNKPEEDSRVMEYRKITQVSSSIGTSARSNRYKLLSGFVFEEN